MVVPSRTRFRRAVVAIAAFICLTLVASCASALGGPASSRTARDGVIRFTFAPDPVWDFMNDEGIVDEFERETGYVIETSATWDEFGLFAGGHADIVSAASFEVPHLELETGRDTTIVGRYNAERSRIMVRSDDPAESLEDLAGKRMGVFTTVSGTLVWAALIAEMHDLDLTSGGDFQIIMADIQNLSDLLARGEIDVCICYPDLSAKELREGSVRPIYDGKSSADLFAELEAPGHDGPMGNVFVASQEWVDGHPDELTAFLDLWNRGLEEWREHRSEIIARYPEHFAVEAEEDVAFMQAYVADHDWVVQDVRFDEEWAADEAAIFDLMRAADLTEEGVPDPTFHITEGLSMTGSTTARGEGENQ